MTITASDIENATVKTLVNYAKELGVTNAHRTPKDELQKKLIAALSTTGETAAPTKETPKAFFDRVSVLLDEKKVKLECETLIQRLGTETITAKSKANKLQPYRKLFKSLSPTPETLHLFFEYRATASQSPIMRHVFDKYTGLANINWDEANQKVEDRKQSKGSDQLATALNEENKVFSLEKYIGAIRTLINSNDCWELACGLIAASGRRPSEILMFGNFQLVDKPPSYIPHAEYAIKVDGLAKKREQNPSTIVSLLIPTKEFIQRVTVLREMIELKTYRETFNKMLEAGYDKSDAWNKIEDSIGNKVRSVTDEFFSFLPKIEDGQNRKNILLRACTTKLIVLRDYPKGTSKAKIQYAGVIAGHIIPVFKEDGTVGYNGQTNASTLNYDDYEPDTNIIPLLANIVEVKEELKESEETMKILELENTIQQLKHNYDEKIQLSNKTIQQLNEKIQVSNKEAQQLNEKIQLSNEEVQQLNKEIQRLNKEIEDKNKNIIDLTSRLNNNISSKEKRPEPLPEAKEMTTQMLFNVRKSGTASEKVERGVNAIRAYNDNVTENRIAITNQAVRELTGVNGQQIRDWLNNHHDEILSHHVKYEMVVPDKNQSHILKTDNYYNSRKYSGEKISQIVRVISKEYLHALV